MTGTYVHGYYPRESERLHDQAGTLVELRHHDTAYPGGSFVLELGCGVGSQTLTLARRSPGARFISIDVPSASPCRPGAEPRAPGSAMSSSVRPTSSRCHSTVAPSITSSCVRPGASLATGRGSGDPSRPDCTLRHDHRDRGDHGSAYFHPDSAAAGAAIDCQVRLQRQAGGNSLIGRELYPLMLEAGFDAVSVPASCTWTRAVPSRSTGFTRKTFTAMIEGTRESALTAGLIEPARFAAGVRALHRMTEADGVFCYTFFKAVAESGVSSGVRLKSTNSREGLQMEFEQIITEVDDAILTITLNRPDRLNAWTPRMGLELISAFDRADADDEVRVIVVTGAGRGFCAGADLGGGGGTFDWREREHGADVPRDGGGQFTLRVFDCTKPVIAAINGPAVGVGATMTLPMDIRIAAESARLGFVFARRGIVPEACSSWFLPRIVGISRAMEWVSTGRVFAAKEALEAGLVRSLHPGLELLDAARLLAREVAENTAPVSVALARRMMWRMLGAEHPMIAHRADSRGMFVRGQSADAAEGVTAFLEKRPARFTDRVGDGLPEIMPGWGAPEFE